MELLELTLSPNKNYRYKKSSSIKMDILADFLSDRSDVYTFRKWAIDDHLGDACSGNITCLEKDGNYIELTDMYSEEQEPTMLRITRQQFVQLLDDWENKVLKLKPKDVIIKHINDEFIFETQD